METDREWHYEIRTFGGFSLIACRGGERLLLADDSNSRLQRWWTLLEYLITFRNRCVAAEELLDVLYPEGESSGDPLNSLRILVHRLRAKLEDVLPGEGPKLIASCGDGYRLNPGAAVSVDAERFEDIFRRTHRGRTDEKPELSQLLEATGLYRGRFLPHSSAERWVIPLDAYFHSEYLSMCAESCAALEEGARWNETITLCKEAVLIDPYAEDIHVALMEALVSSGAYNAAEQHYKNLTEMFYRDFGISPTEKLTEFHERMENAAAGRARAPDEVKQSLEEQGDGRGAFRCELETFRQIYRLKAREYWRTGDRMEFVLLSLAEDGEKHREQEMDRLGEIIRTSLRSGDVYARYSRSQYAILLQLADAGAAERVMERVRKNYRAGSPKRGAQLRCDLYPVNGQRPERLLGLGTR